MWNGLACVRLELSAHELNRDEPSQLATRVADRNGGEASRFVVVHALQPDWESAQRQVRSIRTQFFSLPTRMYLHARPAPPAIIVEPEC